jgi:RNA polymerase sigma-70 factor (ECF subfamily)
MLSDMTAAIWSAPGCEATAPANAAHQPGPAELLRRCGLGDDAAFATLYDQTCLRLFGLVLKVLKDAASAEQVTQEVYLHVWRHSARYDPDRSSALAWIMTTAHRAAVDRLNDGPTPYRGMLTS